MANWVSSIEELKDLASIPVVLEVSDVFPKILLGIQPPTKAEFTIDVASSIEPISEAPYQMATTKLKELKTQLKEMLEAPYHGDHSYYLSRKKMDHSTFALI